MSPADRQATIGDYRRFPLPRGKLVVELDGGWHKEERGAGSIAFLEQRGYRTLLFWNTEGVDNLDGV